jgi:iron complex outermembrane receptor protein
MKLPFQACERCSAFTSLQLGRITWVAIASAWLVTGAIAQSTPASPTGTAASVSTEASGDTGLAEIIVTAQRREENLQRVPISATVLTGAQLQDRGIIDIQQLQTQTPGLSIQPPLNAETFINIRGVGIQQVNPTSSNGVAFYVDGVYVPSLIDTVDSFYDLNNVEVLRGPQGTLVGSNADGGAIFVNSAQPSFDNIKGYFQETLGNYQDRRSEGAINLPINDRIAARVAFVYESQNSFYTNLGPEPPPSTPSLAINQPGNVDYQAARLQLAVKPTDDLTVTLRYEPYRSSTDGYAVKPDMNAVPAGSKLYDPYAASIQNQPFTIDYDTPQSYEIRGQRMAATVAWHITDQVEFKAVTSNQEGNETDQRDLDASSAPAGYISDRRTSINAFTQEINLLSTGPSVFQWVAGAYFLHSTIPLELLQNSGPNASFDAIHTNEAIFASGTYQFLPEWSFTIGGRYSHDNLPYHESPFPAIGNFVTTDSKPTGSLKIGWQATSDTLAYASVSSGYKAGGVNLQLPPIGFTPPPFQPETNVVEEIGVKTTLDNHLRIDGDIFDSQYKHYQLQENTPTGFPLTQGPGDARIYGAELELTGAFDALQFNIGSAFLHATVPSDFPYTLPNGATVTIDKGTEIPFAPKWMINAGLQYDLHFAGNGMLTPRIQFQYQGSQYTNIEHAIPLAFPYGTLSDVVIPSHETVDFRLKYSNGAWSVEGYGENLANKVYVADVILSANGAAPDIAYGAPRQYGVRLMYKF